MPHPVAHAENMCLELPLPHSPRQEKGGVGTGICSSRTSPRSLNFKGKKCALHSMLLDA